jgi:aminoglycoside phosphotransferase (APT) family kinase protein
VLTHGEPHAANVVFTSAGPVLIDWDTTMVAPKERDLWMIAADGFSVGDVSPELIRLYRAQWDLSELWEYARRFANPNDDGPEGDGAWDDFTQYVRRAAHI